MTRRRAQNRRNATRRNYCGGRAEKTGELVPPLKLAEEGPPESVGKPCSACAVSLDGRFCRLVRGLVCGGCAGARTVSRQSMRTAGSIFVFQRARKAFFSGVRSFGAAAPSQGRHQKKRCSNKKAKRILSEPSQDSRVLQRNNEIWAGLETADAGPYCRW